MQDLHDYSCHSQYSHYSFHRVLTKVLNQTSGIKYTLCLEHYGHVLHQSIENQQTMKDPFNASFILDSWVIEKRPFVLINVTPRYT